MQNQMELTFETAGIRPAKTVNRRSRAQWWFGQMRRVVNLAVEWKPTPQARPEQIYMTMTVGR